MLNRKLKNNKENNLNNKSNKKNKNLKNKKIIPISNGIDIEKWKYNKKREIFFLF